MTRCFHLLLREVLHTGAHQYVQCRCGKRRKIHRLNVGGHQPIDRGWLETGRFTAPPSRPPAKPADAGRAVSSGLAYLHATHGVTACEEWHLEDSSHYRLMIGGEHVDVELMAAEIRAADVPPEIEPIPWLIAKALEAQGRAATPTLLPPLRDF